MAGDPLLHYDFANHPTGKATSYIAEEGKASIIPEDIPLPGTSSTYDTEQSITTYLCARRQQSLLDYFMTWLTQDRKKHSRKVALEQALWKSIITLFVFYLKRLADQDRISGTKTSIDWQDSNYKATV